MKDLKIKTKDNPKLSHYQLNDGRISLCLDYYLGRTQWVDEMTGKTKIKHERKRESLNLYLISSPRTVAERESNNKVLRLANEIRIEKEQELRKDRTGKRIFNSKTINYIDFFETYLNNYTKKDIRIVKSALNRFKKFLGETPKYTKFVNILQPQQVDKEMVMLFVEYLEKTSKGEGAKSIYCRFKKVINHAIDKDIITKNPCKGISIKVDDQLLKKDILSNEEVLILINTSYPEQNREIRRAFILSLYTGLRYCDVKDLTYKNIDYSNMLLKFEQNKTKGKSNNSGVIIPLNKSLISLIGEPESNKLDIPIFKLPSNTMCLKSLRAWVKKAGINKHITWHCARHSFAVNILNNGANIKTVSSLLGHSDLKHTEKYTRAVDKLKEDAINSLPELNIY